MFDFKYKNYGFSCGIGTMTPLQYIRMINLLERYKPKRICELGSGESTKIFNEYCNIEGAISYSIEHDVYWNKYNSIMMNLTEGTQLNIAGNVYERCSKYDGFEQWIESQDRFDFVLIDAPNDGIPENNKNLEYARIQMMDFILMDKLSDKSVVLYHDSERKIAKNTLDEFEKIMDKQGYWYYKETVLENDKEIIEYNKNILGVCPQLDIYIITK